MNNQTNYEAWQERRGRIRNSLGQWHAGRDAQFRGHLLLEDLIHNLSEMQLMVYGITGRIISVQLSTWLEKAYFMTSYPDSRLWCNSIASLAAHPGASPVSATVAGFLAADSKAYGSYAVFRAAEALLEMHQKYLTGEPLDKIVKLYSKNGRPPNIPGFLRPLNVADERLQPMRQVSLALGFEDGPYLKFAQAVSQEIAEHYDNGMNAAAYYSAFLLDQDFSPSDLYLLCVRCTECGILACYKAHLNDIEKGFLPLQCSDIAYKGPAARAYPNAKNI